MSDINYNNLVEAYRAAYPEKSKAVQFSSAQVLWNEIKRDNYTSLLNKVSKSLKNRAIELKAKRLFYFI